MLWGSQRVIRVPLGSLVGSRSYEALSGCKVVLESPMGSYGFLLRSL